MNYARPFVERRVQNDRRRVNAHPLAERLASALQTGAIEVLYQPQYACVDGTIAGAEALMRWMHDGTAMAGDALFDIGHEGTLGQALTAHLHAQAFAQASRWAPDTRLSINVTPRDLLDADFADTMMRAMADNALDPERVTIEITEQSLVEDFDLITPRLDMLADRGIRIALDDFGAGFCNFAYLKRLPLDYLKLDRSMIEGVAQGPRDLAVLRGIVAMADALDLKVIAEGVETQAQRDIVCAERCWSWQGFLGSRPVSADDFAAIA
jgi:EAL domain-containing protein (putative c-di-GMP-specific phosphodiesterase class I)